MDHLIFTGDLLTYGHDVVEVLDLVGEAQEKDHAVLLIGNHDQMYFDAADGKRDYLHALPPWIQHSVALTLDRFDSSTLRPRFQWSPAWRLENAFFSHANPFGVGDFRYLNSDQEQREALAVLEREKAKLGVFGHTHRPLWRDGPVILANAGSIGQPRDHNGSVILRIQLDGESATGTFEPIAYDVQAHLRDIQRVGLPEATIAKLCGFFERGR